MDTEDINPYAAPQANVAISSAAIFSEMPNAGLGKRFCNLLLDYLVMFGILFMLFFVLAMLEEMGIESVALPEDEGDFVALVCTNMVLLMYYACCEGLFGRSFGKLITGTKVVTVSGVPLTFGKALLRSCIRILPLEPFSFFGSGYGNGMGLGWHDKWTDTRVIDLRAKPVSKPAQ